MADGPIKVSFAGLAQGAADIDGSSKRIETSLGDLRRQLQALRNSWDGEAQRAYDQKQNQWDTAAHDLKQVLADIAMALRIAGEDYQDGERQNAGRFL
ncbi:WXG100 family type VII secretion target [Herbihabitans rhizosphaerae]|uniref:ESAT-6-like protein n=1 Tax=Herbihabitans rhizosphaerae TaxID=1872711 RepID=A0A4Q7KKM0_9PSEU|nr:WXG100 family type VII secretion target [Herbihabitans rhizosphaerae]RZS37129.1 WXG100 family type VII secretion target [Herbihabitans rhizosphaerae]